MATSVHRIFLAMGIPTEVRCLEQPAAAGVETHVQIQFPPNLSPTQRREVSRVLRLLRPQTALQPTALQ